ncbi:MAG: DUF4435 domain-containing protein [Alistipes sp.]|jgi:hypothetical protein|nr:DUF4435 domain-containing protein [Alistipes sp.]MBQ5924780.1 DUF4435 domain-containing protein [Alistipes sp.]MBR5819075.1 DUF4435 domain-containing protein [Alistipes sp.]MEE1147716.1 DUF4435 domain-containing protein [Alistipes sp.]
MKPKKRFRRRGDLAAYNPQQLPDVLPPEDDRHLVRVYVEGYEDVAFWRGIFDHFRNPYLRFEISVPNREDLPKGKKVLMGMIGNTSAEDVLLCVDSDFDYLFDGATEQSRAILEAENMFHTYTYATENYLCYAPSLRNVCVKATKNDTRIFDFERFMAAYSRAIYPLFLWYVHSAQLSHESVFTLAEFRAAVRFGYVDIRRNGENTLAWLERNVEHRREALERENPEMVAEVEAMGERLKSKGVEEDNCYLYMHGHTLMDNVVMPLLKAVCDKLRQLSVAKITNSKVEGTALKNELQNYTNTLRSIHDVLLDNENYTACPLYKRLRDDIQTYLDVMIGRIKAKTPQPVALRCNFEP